MTKILSEVEKGLQIIENIDHLIDPEDDLFSEESLLILEGIEKNVHQQICVIMQCIGETEGICEKGAGSAYGDTIEAVENLRQLEPAYLKGLYKKHKKTLDTSFEAINVLSEKVDEYENKKGRAEYRNNEI